MKALLLAALAAATLSACGPAPRCRWMMYSGGEYERCETTQCRGTDGRFVKCPEAQ
jgi:hypothetical protein